MKDWIGKHKAALLWAGIDGMTLVNKPNPFGAGWALYDAPDGSSASFFWAADGTIVAVDDGSGMIIDGGAK